MRYPVAPRAQNTLYISTVCYNFEVMNMNVDKIKMIVCDIDNTLIPSGSEQLSERNRNALQTAMASGYDVMINTGRHYTFLQQSLFEDLPMDIIGTINGACLVKRDGTVLETHPLPTEYMNRIISFAQANNIGLGFKFVDHVVTYNAHQKFVDGYVNGDPVKAQLLINDTEKRTHHLEYGNPLGTFLVGDEDVILNFAKEMPDLVFAWSSLKGFDVFLHSINKSLTVEAVLKEKGYTWENVIAFGDAGNDIPFIQKAGIGVALGNAKDDVRQYADIVADTCANDGVAKVLEELGIV